MGNGRTSFHNEAARLSSGEVAGDGPEQFMRMRGLWAKVLLDQWRLATTSLRGSMSGTVRRDIHSARAWFGGRDFRIVADFAGFDPDQILEKLRPKAAEGGWKL